MLDKIAATSGLIGSVFIFSVVMALLIWAVIMFLFAKLRGVAVSYLDFAEHYAVVFMSCFIGFGMGIVTGQSRDSAISGVVPALLTLLGALATVVFARDHNSPTWVGRMTILTAAVGFNVLFIWGIQVGAQSRYAWEKYRTDVEWARTVQAQEFELRKLEYATKLDIERVKRTSDLASATKHDMGTRSKNQVMPRNGANSPSPRPGTEKTSSLETAPPASPP